MLEQEIISKATIRQKGLTLVEVMTVIAVIAILAAVAIPSFQNMIDKYRLKGAVDSLYADLQFARSEAIKRNRTLSVSFITDGSTTWCYGIAENPDCDCRLTDPNETNACVLNTAGTNILKINSSNDFHGIKLIKANNVTFDNVRGTANTSSILFNSADNRAVEIRVSLIGRVRICSPSGSISDYPSC